MRKYVPSYSGTLRSHGLTLPHCISECSGIRIFGKRIKSIAFSTDAAIIKNINADDIKGRIEAGTDIFNVSGAAETASIVRHIREQYPHAAIIATGGPTEESILETIRAGANAITITPPTTGELFAGIMHDYREKKL